MSYNVFPASSYEKNVKQLKKRFRHVEEDMHIAKKALLKKPTAGVVIPGGRGTRKLRVSNSDIPKGKSSGYRLIYLVDNSMIYLLLVYSKSDRDDVDTKELRQLLASLAQELE